MTLFWCKFGLGKHFGMASRSNHWTDCHRLWYKIHFSPHSTIWLKKDGSLLLSSIREDNTSKQGFFFFSVSSWGTKLSSFLSFTLCFKCWTAIEWSVLSASGTSHLVVRGSALMTLSVGHCQLPMAGHCTYLQRSFFPWKNFLNLPCTVLSFAGHGPNASLMLRVVSSALGPILKFNKKISQIYFLSYIIFIV